MVGESFGDLLAAGLRDGLITLAVVGLVGTVSIGMGVALGLATRRLHASNPIVYRLLAIVPWRALMFTALFILGGTPLLLIVIRQPGEVLPTIITLVIVSLLAGIPLGHRVAVGEDEPVSVPAGVAGGVRTLIVGLFFVTLLYSIIGLPTGLGGLIIRRFQTLEVPVGPLALVFGIALVLDLLVGVVHTALAVIAARSAAAYKDAVDEDAARMAPPPAPDLDSPPEEPDASNPPEDSSV